MTMFSWSARLSLWLALAALGPSGCGARTIHLDGKPSDGGSSNPNSTPDAIAPGVSIVIENEETAMRIAVDDARVYWLSRLPDNPSASRARFARVRSCQKSDCAATIVTYDELSADLGGGTFHYFQELAVHGGNVYWARSSGTADHSILSCPSAGCSGPPKTVVSNVRLTTMAVDETHVYWTFYVDGAIMRRSLTGADAPQAIALNESQPDQILVDATHVYWIANRGMAHAAVKRVAKQGGEPPVTLVMEQNQASSLALDSDFFYWANDYSVGAISRCPLSGCAGAPAMLIAGQAHPSALVTDGKSIFWMNWTGEPTGVQGRAAVLRCPVGACASALETLAIQTFASGGLSMAVDQSDVYWVAQGEDATNYGVFPHATIYRHAK